MTAREQSAQATPTCHYIAKARSKQCQYYIILTWVSILASIVESKNWRLWGWHNLFCLRSQLVFLVFFLSMWNQQEFFSFARGKSPVQPLIGCSLSLGNNGAMLCFITNIYVTSYSFYWQGMAESMSLTSFLVLRRSLYQFLGVYWNQKAGQLGSLLDPFPIALLLVHFLLLDPPHPRTISLDTLSA